MIFLTDDSGIERGCMTNPSGCPSPQELVDFCIGKSREVEIDTIAQHLDSCSVCRNTVDDLERLPIPFVEYYLSPVEPDQPRTTADPRFRELLVKLKQLGTAQP